MKATKRLLPFILAAGSLFAARAPTIKPDPWDFDPKIVHGFPEGPARDDIVPGEFFVDPPTLENLGFRWYVEGDRNRNAAVAVSYRRKGYSAWREAQPMLRIGHEIVTRFTLTRGMRPGETLRDISQHYRTGNLFAGSVLFLESGATYEVRFTMSDPDGGAPREPKVVTVATRAEPVVSSQGRTLHVYPGGKKPTGPEESAFDRVAAAYDAARPGDIILIHAGTHTMPGAPYRWTKSGEPGRPIVLRGAGTGQTILEGADLKTDLFHLVGANHLLFEDLTIRRVRTAIDAGGRKDPGASWLTVRRCRIEEAIKGICTMSENSQSWYIADNIITGRNLKWHPRPNDTYMEGSHTGVNVYGQGHVVCYNRISGFSDSLALANNPAPEPEAPQRHPVNVDVYNNDLSVAVDDTLETDHGAHNIRVYRNLLYNAHTALSMQPAYGGPIYFIRNVAYGITSIPFKWNNHPAGAVAYHNTLVSGRVGFRTPLWSNGHLRNNLILGNDAMISSGTFTPELTTLDYNGYHGKDIIWARDREEPRRYATLAEFSAATGLERHGRMVDFDVFVRASPVQDGKTYQTSDFDLRLRTGGKAIDAGVRLPNINDDFTGSAPDLGALEHGRPLPHYGPRQPSQVARRDR
jgi:hypothetical protein